MDDGQVEVNIQHVKTGRNHSPVKENVARKFVGIMEDLGVDKFNHEDFTTQQGLEEKLDFVKDSIKKIKNNIRDLGQAPARAGQSHSKLDASRLSNAKMRAYGA